MEDSDLLVLYHIDLIARDSINSNTDIAFPLIDKFVLTYNTILTPCYSSG